MWKGSECGTSGFIYKNNIHAFYTTLSYNAGKFGLMAGLRGEYWKVNTESHSWAQEHDARLRDKPFKKDYFQLFPSIFMSYQLTKNDQLHVPHSCKQGFARLLSV